MIEYACKPGVAWVKDHDCTIVVQPESGQSWTLRDSEALIWNWLAVGYPSAKVITLLALVQSMSEGMAAVVFADTLHSWADCGLIDEVYQP